MCMRTCMCLYMYTCRLSQDRRVSREPGMASTVPKASLVFEIRTGSHHSKQGYPSGTAVLLLEVESATRERSPTNNAHANVLDN